MKAKDIILTTFGIVCLVAVLLAVGITYARRAWRRAVTTDAVQVVAIEIHEMLQDTGKISNAELHRQINFLLDASVINIRRNRDGKPVDVYGNPFQITYEITQDKITVTCVSLGRDGEEGTPDDIVFVYDGS